MKTIKFQIGKDGSTKLVDACGFGDTCTQATAKVEGRLGKAVDASRSHTPEFYKAEEQVATVETQ